MATYNAFQIVGKTLIAAKNLTAYYGHPESSSKFPILKGHQTNAVYSWIAPKDMTNSWLEFFDSGGKAYFVEDVPGSFESYNLAIQGAKTNEELLKEKKAKEAAESAEKNGDNPIVVFLKENAPKVLIGAGLLYIAGQTIKGLLNRRNG